MVLIFLRDEGRRELESCRTISTLASYGPKLNPAIFLGEK